MFCGVYFVYFCSLVCICMFVCLSVLPYVVNKDEIYNRRMTLRVTQSHQKWRCSTSHMSLPMSGNHVRVLYRFQVYHFFGVCDFL